MNNSNRDISNQTKIHSTVIPVEAGIHMNKQNNALKSLSTASIKQILHNSELDSLDTRLLLAHMLNCSKEKLITNCYYELSENEYKQFMHYYTQCQSGMPISYILGNKEFYSRLFKVTTATLIPRPATEFLVDAVLKLCKEQSQLKIYNEVQPKLGVYETQNMRDEPIILPTKNAQANLSLLDLGTGTGCIAISCKLENPSLEVTATDNYIATLEVARINAKTYNADIDFIQSDWYSNINNQFDIIVSNPPYIEANDEHLASLTYEPQHALTDFADGLSCLRHIISGATTRLLDGGYLVLEHGYNQGGQVRNMLYNQGFSNIDTILDYAGLERITLGRKKYD